MTEIEKVKAEIKMLEKKLSFLEELEKTKSPVEEAYKKVYGVYPTNEITYNSMWGVFQKGYYAAQEDYKVEEPEETEQSLKEAFREAVKQGIIPEVDKVSEVFMNEMVAELKGQTLTDIIWNWWGNVFTSNEEWDAENCIEHLVDLIEAFLPKPQSAEGSQNAYVESAVEGFNDAIKQIKSKLR